MAQVRKEIKFGGLYNSLAESRIPEGFAFDGSNFATDLGVIQLGFRDFLIGQAPQNVNTTQAVLMGFGYGKVTGNSVQLLTITGGVPTSGGATLDWNTQGPTSSVPFNATSDDLLNALLGLSNIDPGDVSCAGGPWPYIPLTATFQGLYAGADQPLITQAANTFSPSSACTITKEVTGGTFEVYLVVVQYKAASTATLYAVTNPNNDGWQTTTWTSVATNLHASNWYFQQIGDKIYGVNAVDGIGWYQLGGGWSVPAGIPGVQRPLLGFAGASQTYVNGLDPAVDSSEPGHPWVVNNFVGWGSSPTPSFLGGSLLLTLVADLTSASVSFDLDTSGNTPSSIDFSGQDYWTVDVYSPTPTTTNFFASTIQLEMVNAAAVLIEPDQSLLANLATPQYYFGLSTKVERVTTQKLRVTLTFNAGKTGDTVYFKLNPGDVWMADTMAGLAIAAGPTSGTLEYAYSYLQASTLLETKLSPVFSTKTPTNTPQGNMAIVRIHPSSGLTSSDFWRLYRKDQFGIYRLIAQGANVLSSPIDSFMEDELLSLTPYGQIELPGGYSPTQIGFWKGCLVVGAGTLVFISEQGIPNLFAPSPDQFQALSAAPVSSDPNDPSPRTLFMSATRSDPVETIIGNGPLYLNGLKSSYAMAGGDTPLTLSAPGALPGSRGALGVRAACPFSGGQLVATQTGLWYYAVGEFFGSALGFTPPIEEEITKDVRGSWAQFLAAGPTMNVVVAVWNEELWCVNGTAYIHRSRNGHWEQGAFDNVISALISDPVNGLIGVGKDSMYQIQAPAIGEDATWSYKTGIMEGPRNLLEHFEAFYTGTPKIFVTYFDGNSNESSVQEFDTTGGVWFNPQNPYNLEQGWRFQVEIKGGYADVMESLFMYLEGLPGGKGN